MKKLLSMVLATGMIFALTACGGGAASEPSKSQEAASAKGDTLKIGLVQLVDNGAFTDMREGFIAQMKANGYTDENMEIDYQNAQGDVTALNTICQKMADSDAELIVTIATPPTQAMVNLESDKPVFYISVSDPIAAGVITNVEAPDKNATGTSNAIPVDELFKLAETLTPGNQTYGLIYNTSEVNSVKTIDAAKAYLEENGLSYKEAVVTNSGEVQQAAQSLVDGIDAFFIPNDSVVQSALTQVAEVAKDGKIPVYGSSAVMVADGAFATVSIDDTKIGAMTADMVVKYLAGTPVEGIPAVTVIDFTTVINQSTADAIGVTLSDEILKNAVII